MLDTTSLKHAWAAVFLVPILGLSLFLILLSLYSNIFIFSLYTMYSCPHIFFLIFFYSCRFEFIISYIIKGLNYLLIPIRPAEGSGLTVAYDIMNAVFSSFQVITTILTLNLSMFCIVYVSIFCVTWIPFGSHLLRLNIFKT